MPLERVKGYMDDPQVPEFSSWDSYRAFSQRVRHKHRYVHSPEMLSFTNTVLATIRDRNVSIREGKVLFRAQLGVDLMPMQDEDGHEVGEEPVGYGAARMKPRPNRAVEGRANPAGIPVLYLGTTEETAIAEVRPWIGAEVSVAQFRTLKDLRAVDLSRGHSLSPFSAVGISHLLGEETPDGQTKERAVWIEIDNAWLPFLLAKLATKGNNEESANSLS